MLAERTAHPETAGTATRAPGRLNIAVIDRDPGFMQVLGKRWQALGHEHRVLGNPVTPEALVAMRLNAVVLDLSVVGPDCWDYIERICSRLPNLAVIVCTAPTSVAQRVRGLRLGVDAWVTKPCHPEELICVIEAVLRRHRRSELAQVADTTTVGELTIRPDLHQAYVGEASVELTAREFEILRVLSKSDRVLRREEIYEQIWGYAMAHGDRSVDVFVRRLRQKLRAASPHVSYIHTHFGVGYRFVPEPEDVGPARDGSELAEPAAGSELDPAFS